MHLEEWVVSNLKNAHIYRYNYIYIQVSYITVVYIYICTYTYNLNIQLITHTNMYIYIYITNTQASYLQFDGISVYTPSCSNLDHAFLVSDVDTTASTAPCCTTLGPRPRQVMQDTLNTVSAGPSNTVRRVEEGELLEVLDGPQEAHEKTAVW